MKKAKLTNLESKISKVANKAVEITIVDEKRFTFSFDGKDETATAAISEFFTGYSVDVVYDQECNFTCVYLNV